MRLLQQPSRTTAHPSLLGQKGQKTKSAEMKRPDIHTYFEQQGT